MKAKYQKILNNLNSFMQGLRSFTRFKISTNKNMTNADKLNQNLVNNNTNNHQFPEGNPWVEIYKEISLPVNSFNNKGSQSRDKIHTYTHTKPNSSDTTKIESNLLVEPIEIIQTKSLISSRNDTRQKLNSALNKNSNSLLIENPVHCYND